MKLIALATLITYSHARECTFTNSTTIFREPAQITNLFICDIFPTSVRISSIFPGTFSLPNIINFTCSISIYKELGPPTLTSIFLDDLQLLGSLDLNQTTWKLDFVSMGAIETVGSITTSSIKKMILRFPGLKSAGVVTLKGNVSTVDFRSLVNVSQINIRHSVLAGQYKIVQIMPALYITSAALQSCGIPRPMLVGGKNIDDPINIDVQTIYESPVLINFDALTNAADVDVEGFVEPLSLQALQYLNKPLRVQTYRPFDCTSLRAVFDHTSTTFAAQYGYNSPEYESRVFRCQSYFVGEPKKGLSQDVQRGLGFGLGLGGGLAAVLGFVWLLRWVRKRKAGKSPGKEGDKGGENAEDQINATTRSETEGDGSETTEVEATVRSSREPAIRVNSIAEVSRAV
ncbi:hypothetical protein EAE99_006957 [Botrytis elliptica]|nr:hypothetical protein EAE99_006957 [Botrytis elliptica]